MQVMLETIRQRMNDQKLRTEAFITRVEIEVESGGFTDEEMHILGLLLGYSCKKITPSSYRYTYFYPVDKQYPKMF